MQLSYQLDDRGVSCFSLELALCCTDMEAQFFGAHMPSRQLHLEFLIKMVWTCADVLANDK